MEGQTMTDIAKLQADLADLNMKCQQARDNEVRYGLQRSRLEAERAQLLANMVEAVQRPQPSTPYAVTWQSAISLNEPAQPPSATVAVRKPDGLPSMSRMVLSVLDSAEAGVGLKPKQIRERIRQRYWPEAPTDRVVSVVWRLAKNGKLHHSDGRYRLNGYNPYNN
jgi:hypothetical protein